MKVEGIYEPTISDQYLRKEVKKREPLQNMYNSAVDLFLGLHTTNIDENMFSTDQDVKNEDEEVVEDSVSFHI